MLQPDDDLAVLVGDGNSCLRNHRTDRIMINRQTAGLEDAAELVLDIGEMGILLNQKLRQRFGLFLRVCFDRGISGIRNHFADRIFETPGRANHLRD